MCFERSRGNGNKDGYIVPLEMTKFEEIHGFHISHLPVATLLLMFFDN